MGWDSAKRYKPRPIGDTGAYKPPAPAEPQLPEPEPEVLSQEDRDTVNRYAIALRQLANEQVCFIKNDNTFQRWDDATRLWWIIQIERQAREGKDTIGVRLVTRVVMNRMEN